MDLKLTEEERLIKDTAAQFVDRELIAREGDYLRQQAAISSARRSGPARSRSGRCNRLAQRARQVGLWTLELPEQFGGSALGAVARA